MSSPCDFDDDLVAHSMNIDDAYRVEKLLARGRGGVTELVSLDGAGPFVRKKIPAKTARREVWSILPECACFRLPRLLATYETPDWYAVVYEYVPGSTLEELVERGGGFDPLGAVRMILDVCEAVLALHAKGVIHRDLAPKNILIAADGVHVIDLGIARCCIDPPSRATAALGTHGFAAPEQYGFADTDVRSDVYSLGCLLGYAITGLPPGEPGAAEAMADRRRVPEAIASIVSRACSFEPSARYQSVSQMAGELSSVLGEPMRAVFEVSGRHAVESPSTRKSSFALSPRNACGGGSDVPRADGSFVSHDPSDKNRGEVFGGGRGTTGSSATSGLKRSSKKSSSESWTWKRTLARVLGLVFVLVFLFACFLLLLVYLSTLPR